MSNLKTNLFQFENQSELAAGYAEFRLDVEMGQNWMNGHDDMHTKEWIQNKREVLRGVAHQIMKYSPISYIGGYVIPGFGYSTERIGQYGVTEENCGNPDMVSK